MIPTYVEQHTDRGELRIGWALWGEGYQDPSIKWAHPDSSGKMPRGSPELPFYILVDMLLLAQRQRELSADETKRIRKAFEGG